MRPMVMLVPALLLAGCATTRPFELAARDPDARWRSGRQEVRRESAVAGVTASTDRVGPDGLRFEVTIANHSSAAIRIDATDFAYRIASMGGGKPLSGRAIDPEAVLASLDLPDAVVSSDAPSREELARRREDWSEHALRRTDLAPGESIRGWIALPAGAVAAAVGAAPYDNRSSLTWEPNRSAPRPVVLTLVPPAVTGVRAMEFELRPR